jgi:DNA-binding Xre family transcriptional regulator
MKITSESKKVFIADLQRYMGQRGWNVSKLAEITGIHQSQVSRIIAGDFKTLSSNVIKICIEFDMEPDSYQTGTRADKDRRHVANSAISIWDGTRRDAEILISLLRGIGKLRKTTTGRR